MLEIEQITKLRIAVAFLGEKDQKNLWPSSFLSDSGAAFLTPVFPKTVTMARVNGASSAARVVHDDHIGVGDVFHLFRLPENIEHNISEYLTTNPEILEGIKTEENAKSCLESIAGDETTKGVGPLLLDGSELVQQVISQMAASYLAAFQKNEATFPYYRATM